MDLFDLAHTKHRQLFSNCLYPWEALKHLEAYFKTVKGAPIQSALFPQVYLVNPESIIVGKGTVIEPGAYIQGPCVIGENCQIRHSAYLRGFVVIGDGCVVGHGTEVKHSILLDGVAAAHFNYVGDSILGNRVQLGAGVKCANFKMNHTSVSVVWEGKRLETGMTKLGALVGDGAHVGCNCVINPGCVVERGALCYPCQHLRGIVKTGG